MSRNKLLEGGTGGWLILLGCTTASWVLSANFTLFYVLIILSVCKLYIIGFSFMEIKRANKMFFRFFLLWSTLVGVGFAVFTAVLP